MSFLPVIGQGACMLSWIPVMCMRMANREIGPERILEFISEAQRELRLKQKVSYESTRSYSSLYFTSEERNAVEQAVSLRNKELLGYRRALKYMEKFMKDQRVSHISRAIMNFRLAEGAWKKLLGEMGRFTMLNLLGRKIVRLF